MKFRKKPVVIEALPFDGSLESAGRIMRKFDVKLGDAGYTPQGTFKISTLEGVMTAMPGDWIIKGVKGELYPCKPDIFEATYEPEAVDHVVG
jgi:hypothetical protein